MGKHPSMAKVQAGRLYRTLLPGVAILLFGIVILLGVLVYKISHPAEVAEAVNPTHYLLPYLEVGFPAQRGPEIPAWWIPGLKQAPGIVLAPGYGMNRTDALSLAVALNQKGFNLLIYSQRGSSTTPKSASTLGLMEAGDMAEAVRFLQSRSESDPNRIGIWGVDVGAFAALKAAADIKEVQALAVDSPYETIRDYLNYRIGEDYGTENGFLRFGCYQVFRLAHLFRRASPNERLPLDALSGKAILFIKGENRKGLADCTTAIHGRIQPPPELISFKTARIHAMSGETLKTYDRQVADFFHTNLK